MKQTVNRLASSFHESFIPERIYLSALLNYSVSAQPETAKQIAEITGIPQGSSSGKVTAHLAYARGMGLVELSSEKGLFKPVLTSLGALVRENDEYIGEPISQLLMHYNLCRPSGGAELWYHTFSRSQSVLGKLFSRKDLETFLESSLGKNISTIGPLLNMYSEDNSFSRCRVLTVTGDQIERKAAPFQKDYMKGYATIFLREWGANFPDRQQATLVEFEEGTNFFAILGWSERQCAEALEEFSSMKVIKVDRMLGSPVITKLSDSETLMETIYSDLA